MPIHSLLLIILWTIVMISAFLYRHKKGKISYLFDLAGKNMGSSTTQSHLLCQLFSDTVRFPWEHISAVQIRVRSARAVSYLDLKEREDGNGEVWTVCTRRERHRSFGGINTWNSPLQPLEFSSSCTPRPGHYSPSYGSAWPLFPGLLSIDWLHWTVILFMWVLWPVLLQTRGISY